MRKIAPGHIGYKSDRISKEVAALEDTWARIISGESSTDDKLLLKLLKSVEIRPSPDEKDYCWMWAEYVDSQTGYGRMSNKRFKTRLTHRISYMLAHSVPDELPRSVVIHHKCGNPYCLKPSHLQETPQSENAKYKKKGWKSGPYERLWASTQPKNKKDYLEKKKTEFLKKITKNVNEYGCWKFEGSHNPNGRPIFGVSFEDKQEKLASRVAYRFFKNETISKEKHVGHECGPNFENKACINPDHLVLMTPKENTKFLKSTGALHDLNAKKKLTDDAVKEICKYLIAYDPTNKAAAEKLGIKENVVESIRARKTYKHITDHYEMPAGRRTGERSEHCRLKDKDIREICKKYDKGTSVDDLENEFEISRPYVLDIVCGRKRNITNRPVTSKQAGLSIEEKETLVRLILEPPPQTLKELAEAVGRSKPEIETAIQKLVEESLITNAAVQTNYASTRSRGNARKLSDEKYQEIEDALLTRQLTTKEFAALLNVSTATIERTKKKLKDKGQLDPIRAEKSV